MPSRRRARQALPPRRRSALRPRPSRVPRATRKAETAHHPQGHRSRWARRSGRQRGHSGMRPAAVRKSSRGYGGGSALAAPARRAFDASRHATTAPDDRSQRRQLTSPASAIPRSVRNRDVNMLSYILDGDSRDPCFLPRSVRIADGRSSSLPERRAAVRSSRAAYAHALFRAGR